MTSHKSLFQASCRRFFASKQLIINAVGSDRLGIVSDLTKYVTDVGGNVGESQASKLGSNFSLMMLVNVPENQVVALVDQLEEIEDITASVHMVKEDAVKEPISKSGIGCKISNLSRCLVQGVELSPCFSERDFFSSLDTGKFSLKGADNAGIVHRVASILANNGMSIDKMETSDEIAPHGGTTLFKMRGIAHAYEPVAAGFDAEKIKIQLRSLGDELNCDIDMVDGKPGDMVSTTT